MIDRERVARILGDGVLDTGLEMLDSLEAAGYRVMPEAMVPQLDDLQSITSMLSRVGGASINSVRPVNRAKESADLLIQLRDLACLVLRIDQSAREDLDR